MRLFLLSFCILFAVALQAQPRPEEFGKCGYYADTFQGKNTANGEKYDKDKLTAAHKSLPFGTIIRVTRLDNQKSVEVRVNDRGPYVDGYITELSRKAAEQIDLIKAGVTKVKVEVVEPLKSPEFAPVDPGSKDASFDQSPDGSTEGEDATGKAQLLSKTQKQGTAKPVSSKTPVAPAITREVYRVKVSQPETSGFAIQIANLNNAKNAMEEMDKLQKVAPDQVLLMVETDNNAGGKVAYKVMVGPFPDRAAAEKKQRELAPKGYAKAFIVDISNQ